MIDLGLFVRQPHDICAKPLLRVKNVEGPGQYFFDDATGSYTVHRWEYGYFVGWCFHHEDLIPVGQPLAPRRWARL